MPGMFPISVNLFRCRCLVVGGGLVATRKVSNLLQCGAFIDVVAPLFTEELERIAREGLISLIPRYFDDKDIQGHMMVFAATDDEAVNQSIYQICQTEGILVNSVDDPKNCNFFVPAIVRRGALTISVSTEGNSPLLARKIREQLEDQYGPEYADYLELLGEARGVVKGIIPQENRRRVFESILILPVLKLLQQDKKREAKERILQCIYSWLD